MEKEGTLLAGIGIGKRKWRGMRHRMIRANDAMAPCLGLGIT